MNADHVLLRKCREALSILYGSALSGLMLYGSCARQSETPESDIDLLVLLKGPVNPARELERIWSALYPLQLDSDRHLSILPADAEEYRQGKYQLYRLARQEGIAL